MDPIKAFDTVIVGAGFAGLYMLRRLRGQGFSARVVEAGAGIGGTWYWNRYPGARCDVESLMYSFSFSDALQQEWAWSERYAAQPEILRYIQHVADRFDLARDVQLETRVTAAVFEEATGRWRIETDQGDRFSAQFCILATGCASTPIRPPLKGLDRFSGECHHTGFWPHEAVDFSGKRVGVIGTGSSAIQAIPPIAEQASHLTVFQRTPNFSVPAWNGPLEPAAARGWKANYPKHRRKARISRSGILFPDISVSATELAPAEQRQALDSRWSQGGLAMWSVFADLLTNPAANQIAAAFVRSKIRETVQDPGVAELLCPRDYPFGAKRLCVDTGYYETFNRENVTLVDIKAAPIEEVTPEGLRSRARDYPLDAIVLATGFDAMTGALLGIDIRGRDGVALKQRWAQGPRSYLGIAVAGFPNLFTITGPGSPSVLSNMIVSIEQHVDWVTDCVVHLREHGLDCIEATLDAEQQWVDQIEQAANQTLFPEADSWYLGANVPGKPRVIMPYLGGVGEYRKICRAIAARGYSGFDLKARPR